MPPNLTLLQFVLGADEPKTSMIIFLVAALLFACWLPCTRAAGGRHLSSVPDLVNSQVTDVKVSVKKGNTFNCPVAKDAEEELHVE
eukprot:1150426-Pelagomonas_calceolata.AAC.7